jgi:hypothetical protein
LNERLAGDHSGITMLSFRPAGEIFKDAGNIRTSQDSSLHSECQLFFSGFQALH